MSINPVSGSLLRYYGPLGAANSSASSRSAALAAEAPLTTANREIVSPAADSNHGQDERADSTLERALLQARVTIGPSAGVESHSGSGRHAPAIGLYRRVSQYSDEESSASGLLKSWDDIVRENRFEHAGVAGHLQAVAQNDALALPSSILHLTV